MNESMLWSIVSVLTLFGLAVFAYLLLRKTPNKVGSFGLGDLTNMATLVVAIFSLYVAVAAYQKSVKDSEEQQKSLDASRERLQAVVEMAQKQQEVLTQHLETSKAQLTLQQEFRRQENERASRKPKLHVFIDDKSYNPKKMTTGLTVDKDKRTRLPIMNKNIGSAPLHKPIFLAVASRKDINMWFDGANPNPTEPYKAQLSGNIVMDILPFDTSKQNFRSDLLVGVPPGVSNFDITYSVIGENLESPFIAVFHIHLASE